MPLPLGALPSFGSTVPLASGAPVALSVPGGGGGRELGRQAWSVRWIVVVTVVGQVVFLGPEAAAANTVRVVAALLVAGLVPLTTPVAAMPDALERGLQLLVRVAVRKSP